MLYTLPNYMQTSQALIWPTGAGGIPAVLPDGSPIAIPVLKGVNSLTVGVVGTGKTWLYTLPAAKILLESSTEMKGVFFESKHTFIDYFMKENDKVIAHSPNAVSSNNLFRPNIIREIRQSFDPEAEMLAVAEFLYTDLLDSAGQNRPWVLAAIESFVGVFRVIIDLYPKANTSNRILVDALRRMSTEDLLAYMAKHPRNHSMLRKNWQYDPASPSSYKPTRRASDIQFYFQQGLDAFSGAFALDGTDTIHDWMYGKYGRNIFLLYDLLSAGISRPWFLYYLKKIKDYKLSHTSGETAPVLMVLDEIDKMADGNKTADWGMFQAANLGREAGLQLLVTTQSLENLYSLSPDFNEHITEGGLAGFPNITSFRVGDPGTIKSLQTLYGSEYKKRIVMPASRYGKPDVKSELEPIVTDLDFASLRTGDCYVKIQACRPQKVHIINHFT